MVGFKCIVSRCSIVVALLFLLCSNCTAGKQPINNSFVGFTNSTQVSIDTDYNYYEAGSTFEDTMIVTVQNGYAADNDGTIKITGPGTITPNEFKLPSPGQRDDIDVTFPDSTGSQFYSAWFGRRVRPENEFPPEWGYYSANKIITTFKIRIKHENIDITNTTVDTIVGKRVLLTAEYTPSDIPHSGESWVIDGYTVGNYEADINRARTLPIDTLVTTQRSFYWYFENQTGGRNISFSSFVDNNTRLATARATFQVKRPTATLTTTIHAVAADNDYPDAPALHFGRNQAGKEGITFDQTINEPAGFTGGNFQWVQTGTAYRQIQLNDVPNPPNPPIPGQWGHTTGSGIDKTYPYPKEADGNTSDSPGHGPLDNTMKYTTANDSYTMYLMYKPSGVNTIWVPLRSVAWSWSGNASRTGLGIWTLGPGSTPNTAPNSVDCSTFPTWNTNIHPLIWVNGP